MVYPLTTDVWPIAVARAAPSRRARCWTAVVKNEDEETSSQRSKLERANLRLCGVAESAGGIYVV